MNRSNLRTGALHAERARLQAPRTKSRLERSQAFHARARALFSPDDLKTGAALTRQHFADWHRTSVATIDAAKRDADRVTMRQRLNRQLLSGLPHYRKYHELKQGFLKDHGQLATAELLAAGHRDTHVNWGDVVATASPDAQDFVAPFTVYDVHKDDEESLIENAQSFVTPDTGHMMNAFAFYHRMDPGFLESTYGLSMPTPASNLVSCGINFTTPRAGRLQISGVLQNFYSEILYNIRDNGWFSWATVDIRVALFIAVEQGGTAVYMPTTILSKHLSSDGGDVPGAMSGFDDVTPYVVSGTTEQAYSPGATVQVLVGCEVHIDSEVDDMSARINAAVRWQLKKLTIGVV